MLSGASGAAASFSGELTSWASLLLPICLGGRRTDDTKQQNNSTASGLFTFRLGFGYQQRCSCTFLILLINISRTLFPHDSSVVWSICRVSKPFSKSSPVFNNISTLRRIYNLLHYISNFLRFFVFILAFSILIVFCFSICSYFCFCFCFCFSYYFYICL